MVLADNRAEHLRAGNLPTREALHKPIDLGRMKLVEGLGAEVE